MWEDIASHLLILIFVSTYDSFFASIYEHIMTHFLFCQSSFLVIFLILRTLNNGSKTKFFSICMNNRKHLHSNNPTQNTSWHTSITADTQNPARNTHLHFILRLATNGMCNQKWDTLNRIKANISYFNHCLLYVIHIW